MLKFIWNSFMYFLVNNIGKISIVLLLIVLAFLYQHEIQDRKSIQVLQKNVVAQAVVIAVQQKEITNLKVEVDSLHVQLQMQVNLTQDTLKQLTRTKRTLAVTVKKLKDIEKQSLEKNCDNKEGGN